MEPFTKRVAGLLDLVEVLQTLATKRSLFNSEADFQFALGWEIQLACPSARVRMEYRPVYLDRRGYLDLWVTDEDWTAAIEVKYFTRALDHVVGDEHFELLNQGAQDISRYDFARRTSAATTSFGMWSASSRSSGQGRAS